jgi:mono/diheme cytochrome c family protein
MDVPSHSSNGASRVASTLRVAWFVAGAVLGVTSAVFVYEQFHQQEATPALRGLAVARNLGCFACHGENGRGGVADPGSRNGFIPGWDGPTVSTLAANDQEIREWIMDGAPARLKAVEKVARRSPAVPMPAYRGRVSEAEYTDLLVFFRAVSNFGVEMPEPVYEGWKVADRLGCFGCHGPGGSGGTPNPGSFKGHIPAWDGHEFAELVRNDAELLEWILDGYPKRLWNNLAARHFLEGQIIGMPAYRSQLSSADQAKLLAYFQWLRKQGTQSSSSDNSHKIMGLVAPVRAKP